MTLVYKMKTVRDWVLNIFFKEKCLGCQKEGTVLCLNCINSFDKARAIENKKIFAVFDYRNDLVRRAIWELKYHHNRHIGEIFGEILYESLLEEISDIWEFSKKKKIIVIPVPISRKKIHFRGYNQSTSIARGFCNSAKVGTFDLKSNIVSKIIDVSSQAKISNRKKRIANVRGSFCLKKQKLIKGETVIIIDDVVTTGATMREMMKILKNAGARKVFGIAVAH